MSEPGCEAPAGSCELADRPVVAIGPGELSVQGRQHGPHCRGVRAPLERLDRQSNPSAGCRTATGTARQEGAVGGRRPVPTDITVDPLPGNSPVGNATCVAPRRSRYWYGSRGGAGRRSGRQAAWGRPWTWDTALGVKRPVGLGARWCLRATGMRRPATCGLHIRRSVPWLVWSGPGGPLHPSGPATGLVPRMNGGLAGQVQWTTPGRTQARH